MRGEEEKEEEWEGITVLPPMGFRRLIELIRVRF